MAWARTYLKGMGLLIKSERGVWTIAEAGQTATQRQMLRCISNS